MFEPLTMLRVIWSEAGPKSTSQRAVLTALVKHADKDGRCYPGQTLLSAETSLCERAVRTALRELEAAHWLDVSSENRAGRSNLYTLRTPAPDAAPAPNAAHPGTWCPPPRHQMPVTPAPDAGTSELLNELPIELPSEVPSRTRTREVPVLALSGAARKPIASPAPSGAPKPVSLVLAEAAPVPGPEVEALLSELRRHDVIASAARAAPAGESDAVHQLAETVAGRALAAGKPLGWVIAAVGEAAADLSAEGPGLQWAAVAKKVRTYADRARAPRVEPANDRRPEHLLVKRQPKPPTPTPNLGAAS